MTFPGVLDLDLAHIAPALTLLVTAAAGLLFALWHAGSRTVATVSLLGVITAFVFALSLLLGDRGTGASFGLRYLVDTPALAFTFLVLIGTALAVLVSVDQLERRGLAHPEYYPLMLLSAVGAIVMGSAGDLITLVLGLEILSLPVYALSAWRTSARQSQEAGMKYFLLGAFASAVLIYGAALVYGASGSFVYADIKSALAAGAPLALASVGGLLVLGGLAFKAALAPFHQWAPDVYTGAPTTVTTFMSVVVKTAAFAALVRMLTALAPDLAGWLTTALAVMVALTLVVGNLGALLQRGLKRMLAYSAVAHAGYIGLALLDHSQAGLQATAWYLSAYTFMNVGAFAVLVLIMQSDDSGDEIERFAGLGRRRPLLALCMTLFMLSLAGIPPLAGFAGKLMVFQSAIAAGYTWLAVLGILTSVVALVYYFRVIGVMYFRPEPDDEQVVERGSRSSGLAIALAVLGTVLLGILPGWWYQLLGGL